MMSRKSGKKWISLSTSLSLTSALVLSLSYAAPKAYAETLEEALLRNDQASRPQASAAPAAAPARAAETRQAGDIEAVPSDLSYEELKQLVKGFDVEVKGEDPNKTVTLKGMIFQECLDQGSISISNSELDSSIKHKEGLGFRVSDETGKGIACLKKFKQAKASCNTTTRKCVALSRHFEGATMKLSGIQNNAKVGVIAANPDSESDRFTGLKDEEGKEIEHKSASSIAREQHEARESARIARLEANELAFKSCRKDLDELDIARKALRQWAKDSRMAISELDQKLKELEKVEAALIKKEKRKQLAELKKKIRKVKDVDEATALSEEMVEFASENPDLAKEIGGYQQQLAEHVVDLPDATTRNYTAAREILGNALGIDGLSDGQVTQFTHGRRSYEIAGVIAGVQGGSLDLSTLLPTYMNLMKSSYKDVASSCRARKNGTIADGCVEAQKNYRAVAALPTVAQQAQLQNARMQMDMERSILMATQGGNYGMNNQALGVGANGGVNSAVTGIMPNFQMPGAQGRPF